ncbi:MAG TPA: flagellar hook capping FlgD N-terminal domain-containing protein [Beijerinckiaceae bacterium]|jgi:flagellar basal-body rod modification protein FlgD
MADAITSTGSAAASAAAATGKTPPKGIAQNFDAFLLLLTTQLKNQSPLDPLDTNQFTQQLVQFASVEQQLKQTETLGALLATMKASTASNAASFVGMQVTADGATTRLSNGGARWVLNAARNASHATITIRDKAGGVVATRTGALAAGAQTFTWDGKTSTGTTAPDGDYTVTVAALDASGQGVSVKTEIAGRVDSVDMTGDAPQLVVGTVRVPLSSVKTLGLPI